MRLKTSLYRLLLTIGSVGFLCTGADAVQRIQTYCATADIVLAEEVLSPDAVHADFAPIIQKAIDRIAEKGGGVLFLTAGEYPILSRLRIKSGVTLRGDGSAAETSHSVLCIDVDRGNEDAPETICLERGSGLKGLTFWYPEQKAPLFTPYPWTVHSAEMPANDNQTISDCTFVNAWKAIQIGPEGNELHTFRNVRICALKTGISLDSTTDIGRMSEVTISPSIWLTSRFKNRPSAQFLQRYLRTQDTCAVDIGRSDWEYIWRLHVDGYRVGLQFRKGKRGLTNAVMAESDITDCAIALLTDELNGVGLAVYTSRFAGDVALKSTEAFSSCSQFHTCSFSGAFVLQNRNRGANSFQTCTFDRDLLIQSGQFFARHSTFKKLAIASTVGRLRLIGNTISQLVLPDYQTVANDWLVHAESARTDTHCVKPDPMIFPRPAGDSVYAVTDFGACTNNPDNAAAFQRALDAAKKTGGTVYVPAGLYAFRQNLVVPRGVELRGSSDVPYHTISGGAILMPYHNRNVEQGNAFIQLSRGSGVRGVTVWYPEQVTTNAVPYPWSIQAQGPDCWVVDVVIGNAWQGVDFATYPSAGHRINYLAGGFIRRGLFVGNAKGRGWVEDVQFNPHYLSRLDARIQRVSVPPCTGERVIELQRRQLEGLVFSNCSDEQIRGTFVYAANHGIRFEGDCHASVLMHGTDTATCGAVLDLSARGRVYCALAQLVPLSPIVQAAIVSLPRHQGFASFYASQFWAGPCTALLQGPGTLRMEQFNTLSGPLRVNGGHCDCALGYFNRPEPAHVAFSESAGGSVIAAVYRDGALAFSAPASNRVTVVGGSAAIRRQDSDRSVSALDTFRMDKRTFVASRIATPGGGVRNVSHTDCDWVCKEGNAQWRDQIVLKGHSDNPAYSFLYCVVADTAVTIRSDSVLRYWIKPENANSRATGVDLLFDDNSVLRESGLHDLQGHAVTPGARRGEVGQWTLIEVPLAGLEGKTVKRIMVAYDTRQGGGDVLSAFSGISIQTDYPDYVWSLLPIPPGGRISQDSEVILPVPAGEKVWYTLDGSSPTVYTDPLRLPRKGFVQLNYAPMTKDGSRGRYVFTTLFDVQDACTKKPLQ